MKKFAALSLSVITLFIGCQKQQKDHFFEKKQLNLNFTQEPSTIDPRKNAEFASSAIQFLMYEGLYTLDPSGVVPALAESHTVSEDKTLHTFKIKKAYWSNKMPITAYDFEYTWKDMIKPDFPCPNAHLFYPMKNAKKIKRGLLPIDALGVTALDERTLQVELEHPTPYLKDLLSFCAFSPVCQAITQKHPNWAEAPGPNLVTNGPYQLVSWKRGGEMLLTKNPYYWNADKMELENISISIINNENTALSMFEQQQLDIIGLPFTSIPYDALQHLKTKNQIQTNPAGASTACFFNVQAFPFYNKNIRKAFALAISRQDIVDNITQLNEKIGTDFVPPALKEGNYYSLIKDNDGENARKHLELGLEELGITKEELGTLTYIHASSDESSKIAQALQEKWRNELGIPVELKSFEYPIFMSKFVNRDYQFGQGRWIAQYPDQMNILERFLQGDNPKNYCGWYSPQFNNLLKKSILADNKEERFKILAQAEEAIAEDMPFTVLFHWNTIYLKQPYLRNLQMYPTGGFHFLGINFDDCLKETLK